MKLTYEDKVQIYELRKQGESFRQLSNQFGINISNLRYKIKLIDRYGIEIAKKGKKRYYSPELKEEIINNVLLKGRSLRSEVSMILWTCFGRIVSNQRRCPNESTLYQRVQGNNCSIARSRTACFRFSQRLRSCQPYTNGFNYTGSLGNLKIKMYPFMNSNKCAKRWLK